jgi:HK97 family phage prohead protease
MKIERRTFALDSVKIERLDDETPVIRGHAAVFNHLSEDLGGFREQISPGAFADALSESQDVRALFNHDPSLILGRNRSGTLRLKEDKEGLAVEIDPPDTQYARDLVVSMDRGDVSQMSFGFRVRRGGQRLEKTKDGQIIRTLTNVNLFDVCPVTYPAYPDTDVALRSVQDWQASLYNPTQHNLRRLRLELEELR